jgi:hypothetical protein
MLKAMHLRTGGAAMLADSACTVKQKGKPTGILE